MVIVRGNHLIATSQQIQSKLGMNENTTLQTHHSLTSLKPCGGGRLN
jgi:hypothetical protein